MSIDALTEPIRNPDKHTTWELHLLSVVPVAFLAVVLGHHPAVALPLAVGAVLPEADAIDRRIHRSWLLHTFLLPAVLYWGMDRFGLLSPPVATALHFLTLGIALHLLADYVYPKGMDHPGSEWPVQPVFISAPWGLIWMGLSWMVQWFLYLSPAFLPWFATEFW